jgi:hypothetical protein
MSFLRKSSIIEGSNVGWGDDLQAGDKLEYLVAMRGTDGPDLKDWLQNVSLSVPAWESYRERLTTVLFERLDGVIPATGIVHFTGQSLGGGLAQYAAYEFASELQRRSESNPDVFSYSPSHLTLTTFNAFAGGGDCGSTGRFSPMLAMSRLRRHAI